MNILEKIFVTTLGSITTSGVIDDTIKNYDTDVTPPIDSVSIIMPAYNEEMFVEQAVSSIKYQSIILNYPEYFEFIFVDNGSTDNTVNLARPFVDKIILTQRGKLTARNIGTLNSSGNIIVTVDADAFYPYHWLNTLLKPFNDPRVVAVSGSIIDEYIPIIPKLFINLQHLIDRKILFPNRIAGSNGAYYKHLFYLIGTFNENINQFDVHQMINEEEKNFGNKLSKFGEVIFKMNASCIHLGGQKVACRWGIESKKFCDDFKFGKDRF